MIKLNQKGQGLIETIFILPWLLIIFIFIFEVIFFLNIELAIDNLLDNYLICRMEENFSCAEKNQKKLSDLPIRIRNFDYHGSKSYFKIQISFKAMNMIEVSKTRELNFEKKL